MLKATVKIEKQMFPKYNAKVYDGDFAILKAYVTSVKEGELHPTAKDKYGCISIKGNVCEFDWFEEYEVILREDEQHPIYGMSYVIKYIGQPYDFSSVDKQQIFLSKILTGQQVESLYSTLDNPFDALENENIELLCTVKGIGHSTANRMIEKYQKSIDYSTAMVELDGYGLSNTIIQKLTHHYGSPDVVVAKVKQNPYILADEVDGIGFKKADIIALNKGINEHDPRRVEAFIKFILNEAAQNGFSWVYSSTLVQRVREELDNPSDETIINCVQTMVKKGTVWNGEKGKIALKYYYDLEYKIANELYRIANAESRLMCEGWEERIKKVEKLQNWDFTNEQIDGIKMVMKQQVCVLTGKAGTGKSSTVLGAIKSLGDVRFAQCALSGKASARLKEVTGYDAYTIHRLLGFNPKLYKATGSYFEYNKDNQIPLDVLILDEFSMIGGSLFLSLIEAIPTGCKFIMLGDFGQLPSIGSLNLARDITLTPYITTSYLTQIHRQAERSAIIVESMKISEGIQITEDDYTGKEIRGTLKDLEIDIHEDKKETKEKILQHFKEKLTLSGNDIMEVQVIVPMNWRGDTSVFSLNPLLQQIYNPPNEGKAEIELKIFKDKATTFRVGDKLLNIQNNYKLKEYKENEFDESQEDIAIFNGFLGVLKEIKDANLIVYFPIIDKDIIIPKSHWERDKGLILGYAQTCHKGQGSSYHYPICAIDYSHYQMLTREWVYTAITRASKHCVLIAQNSALHYSISQTAIEGKQTFLMEMLEDLYGN